MKTAPSAQFEVLSNSLRVFSEAILRLNYYLHELNEPDEGISNIEINCANCLNQLYGMMCTLKDSGHITSIYEHQAITTMLCIRHVLQHLGGKIKNNLRDSFNPHLSACLSLVDYGAADSEISPMPFYVDMIWILEGIKNSNNSSRLPSVEAYLNANKIKSDLIARSKSFSNVYLGIFPLITEAMRQLCTNYGNCFEVTDYDANVYFSLFRPAKALDFNDYRIRHIVLG